MSKETIENELYAANQALTTYYDWLKAGNDSGRGKSLDHIMDLLKKCKDNIKKFNKKEEVEGTIYEATVVMDAIDPKSKTLKKLLKKYNVKMKVLTMNGPGGGHPEVEMTGSREDLQAVLADPNGWDDPELGEYIEESNITEARSINKISKEFGETVTKMKDIVKIYIAAEDGSDEKASTRQQLIDLTLKKKALTNELDDAVAGKNKDVKLVISEGVMSDINQMIGNHKTFDTFQKEFFKEYGHKKVMKKTPEFLEWLEAMYNDAAFEDVESIEEKSYNKKSLMKSIKNHDDAFIIVKGQQFLIKNPDSNNDDNAAMWHDDHICALDFDGEEHEIKYKDIEDFAGESHQINLDEAKAPKNWDSQFTMKAIEAYEKGEFNLEDDKSIAEWNKEYNGGKAPKPAFNTIEVISYAIDTGKKPNGDKMDESVVTEARNNNGEIIIDKLKLSFQTFFEAGVESDYDKFEKFWNRDYKDLVNSAEKIKLNESVINEAKIQIKRRYTDNHPAKTSGRIAKVRNAMIEALADGILTEEEFSNILKEKTIDNKRWMRRNSKYFKISENGISLSKFGKRILTGIRPVVSLTLESFINEANYIKFKGKKVDISSLEMEDVDMKDYPDFSDAYFSYGEYSNGKEMTEEELSDFTDSNLDLANELAHESLH
jgi:hypothetical protein